VVLCWTRLPTDLTSDRGATPTLLMCELPPPPDTSERSERHQLVDEPVSRLSPKKRLVLVPFEIKGAPIEEVVKIARCPKNTAWSRLHYPRPS
jgi:DNA-directed RNA polymerase specialized sigma24 family protein